MTLAGLSSVLIEESRLPDPHIVIAMKTDDDQAAEDRVSGCKPLSLKKGSGYVLVDQAAGNHLYGIG